MIFHRVFSRRFLCSFQLTKCNSIGADLAMVLLFQVSYINKYDSILLLHLFKFWKSLLLLSPVVLYLFKLCDVITSSDKKEAYLLTASTIERDQHTRYDRLMLNRFLLNFGSSNK